MAISTATVFSVLLSSVGAVQLPNIVYILVDGQYADVAFLCLSSSAIWSIVPLPAYSLLICIRLILFLGGVDFGWADASWHRESGYKEVSTPHMQELLDTGIELDRYIYPLNKSSF